MRAKRLPTVAAAVVLVVGGGCAGYRSLPYRVRQDLFLFGDEPWDEMRFDSARWKSREVWADDDFPGGKQPLRGMMIADLARNHLRLGMTKPEVERLLGLPDSPEGNDATKRRQKEWEYALGAWSGFRMDGDYLTVAFDAQGRVEGFGAWQS